jgi:hypothetical protein
MLFGGLMAGKLTALFSTTPAFAYYYHRHYRHHYHRYCRRVWRHHHR